MPFKAGRFRSQFDRTLTGVRSVVLVPKPAAGAEWTINVPAGQNWRVMCGNAQFVTSATVANRFPGVQVTVDGSIVWKMTSLTAIPASTTRFVAYDEVQLAATNATFGVGIPCPFPDIWLPQATTIASYSPNIDAGDQYSLIALYVEKGYWTDGELTDESEERETAFQAYISQLENQPQ